MYINRSLMVSSYDDYSVAQWCQDQCLWDSPDYSLKLEDGCHNLRHLHVQSKTMEEWVESATMVPFIGKANAASLVTPTRLFIISH